MKEVPVEVNQRDLIDKVLARYPEEFTVFRELLQNADDANAKHFVIDFQQPPHKHAGDTNGTKPPYSNSKVSKWLVKNDGNAFEKSDWKRLARIAEGNPDAQKIGAFGVGFYSVFSVTDKPIVKSNGKMASVFYKDGGNQLYLKKEKCDHDRWTVIEMELKENSPVPRIFDLTRFLVTSMTFLVNISCVTISLDDKELSCVTKTRHKASNVPIPGHMVKTSGKHTMTINTVDLISQEVEVKFSEPVGGFKTSATQVDSEESERNKPTWGGFFRRKDEDNSTPKQNGKIGEGVALEAPSLKHVSTCSIYSANVVVSATQDLENGLEHATKKKPPKDFSFEMVFFSKEEHDKRTQEGSERGSVFHGPQGLCPLLEGLHPARIFIGQSTAQTTGMACHMSGRFIPTVERGSIDLANGHVATWNKELLYVGGFLARIAYESEMKKVSDKWLASGNNDVAKELALYTMKSFMFHPSTPDAKVSDIIKQAFFDCSQTDSFPLLSDKGIRHTKDIRHHDADFASFMHTTPVLPVALRSEISYMIQSLPLQLKIKPYAFRDVATELQSRWLTEPEMVACLRWLANLFGRQNPLDKDEAKCRREVLNAGKTHVGGKAVELSVIRKFVEQRMLIVRNLPLPDDTIPPALLLSIDDISIRNAFGWQEMSIIHWLQHIRDGGLDPAHSITQNPSFAQKVIGILSSVWPSLPDDSRYEVREMLEEVACIPTTSPSNHYMHRPRDAYFPDANVFGDLSVVRDDLLTDINLIQVLQFLGVRRRCEFETVISKAMESERWDAMDLARCLLTFPEHIANQALGLKLFPCRNGERSLIKDVFASTEVNRQLGLPVINCRNWNPNNLEAQLLIGCGLRENPAIEDLIPIASLPLEEDRDARTAAFTFLCGPHNEVMLEKHFDPSKFSSHAFIPGIKDGKKCLVFHDEVFSDPSWTLFGFYHLHEKKLITKLKIRDRPTAEKLFQVLESNPPKNPEIAAKWFQHLAVKGVLSAGDFAKIAKLKFIPVLKSTSEHEIVTPQECFLASDSYPEDHFYQKSFNFVNFGAKANAFLRACGVKERPECIDVLKVILKCPRTFLNTAKDHEKYLGELRKIAVGHKSLPLEMHAEMAKAPIFLGYRRQKVPGQDRTSYETKHELLKAEQVLVADDMESCRAFGDYIYIAPQEELLERFYSEMSVKLLSSCVKYKVDPRNEHLHSEDAQERRKCIIDKIPIFLYEIGPQRFKKDMQDLDWETNFFVRACKKLDVTKKLEFTHAEEELRGQEEHHTDLSAEIQVKEDVKEGVKEHVLWVKDGKVDSYDIAAALCRMLFVTYKKNDVLSLMTILDTDVEVLKRRGYDVDRIVKQHKDKAKPNSEKAETDKTGNVKGSGPVQPPVCLSKDGIVSHRRWIPSAWEKLMHRLRKNPKLGEIKSGGIDAAVDKVMGTMHEESDKNANVISNREQVGGGKKQKNVSYCDQTKVTETDLQECENEQVGQIKVWKRRGTILEVPPEERKTFGQIISYLAIVFQVNQTRCHIFHHGEDPNLMGFNRNNDLFFGLEHYIEKHHNKVDIGKAYIDWYYIMAHELAHVHTPYHDEHHELLFSALTAGHLSGLHNLPQVRQMFNCSSSYSS